MSRLTGFLSAAFLLAIAPQLGAQASGRQGKVKTALVGIEQTAAGKTNSRGKGVFHLSAAQRAPDPSTLVVVTLPNGEQRLALAKKRTK
jgi:hypothetical protein